MHKKVKVCDGDTITFGECGHSSSDNKVRLLGIDAFEMDQNKYGKDGKVFLKKLLKNKEVCIEPGFDKKDVYGRTLGYIYVDGKLVNEELVRNGYAVVNSFYPNTQHLVKLQKAQIHARKNMLGYWKTNKYIKETPYEYRKRMRKN